MFLLIGAAVTMSFMACTGGTKQDQPENDSTEVTTEAEAEEAPETPAEPEAIKGPATYETDVLSINVLEGWQVTKQSEKGCTIEPVEAPEGSSNFGWKMEVYVWDSKVFKAEDAIKTEQDVFENSKSQANQKLGDYTYLYTYCPYEFGDHSVLAAPLSSDGGYINVKIGGYKLEDTPDFKEMIKSIKVKTSVD